MQRTRRALVVTLSVGIAAGTAVLAGVPALALAAAGTPLPQLERPASGMAGMSSMAGTDMSGPAFSPNLDPGESVVVKTVPKVVRASATYDENLVTHREFQANCVPNHTAADDPIVFPGKPGAAHDHTFMGALNTDAFSTTASLARSATSCNIPDDHSAYWFPTLYAGDRPIVSTNVQTVYYKAAITAYKTVRPFPRGLRFVVGSPKATKQEFQDSPGTVVGWECGDVTGTYEFGDYLQKCAGRGNLNIRFKAPSCWDGVHLDSADHRSHMAYPITVKRVVQCPSDHPVAVPMLEFKLNFPLAAVGQDISRLRLSSGGGSSWHYDFFESWEPRTLAAMVTHCLNGGLQCNTYGWDGYKPDRGSVLDADHRLLAHPAR